MKRKSVGAWFKKELVSRVLFALLSMLLSAALILSMPILSALVKGDVFKKKSPSTTQIVVKKVDLKKPKVEPKREARRPERSKPNHRNVKSGPRFAMNLDVAGTGGANVSLNLVNKTRGGGGEFGSGDVDKKPNPVGRLEMEVPEKVKEMEVDAEVILTFCVDVSGRAYDIRVINEEPAGLGMSSGGVRAIQGAQFEPAIANNEAVAFCGVEKEFLFKFSE